MGQPGRFKKGSLSQATAVSWRASSPALNRRSPYLPARAKSAVRVGLPFVRQTSQTGSVVIRATSSSWGQGSIAPPFARAVRSGQFGHPGFEQARPVDRHKTSPLAINKHRIIVAPHVRRWTAKRKDWKGLGLWTIGALNSDCRVAVLVFLLPGSFSAVPCSGNLPLMDSALRNIHSVGRVLPPINNGRAAILTHLHEGRRCEF